MDLLFVDNIIVFHEVEQKNSIVVLFSFVTLIKQTKDTEGRQIKYWLRQNWIEYLQNIDHEN